MSLFKPETVHEFVPVAVQVAPPGLAVTTYVVTAEPPELAGACHETVDWEFSFPVAVTFCGAEGVTAAMTSSGSS